IFPAKAPPHVARTLLLGDARVSDCEHRGGNAASEPWITGKSLGQCCGPGPIRTWPARADRHAAQGLSLSLWERPPRWSPAPLWCRCVGHDAHATAMVSMCQWVSRIRSFHIERGTDHVHRNVVTPDSICPESGLVERARVQVDVRLCTCEF